MAQLKMWGNSAAVRIPSPMLEAAHFAINETVRIHAEVGRIVIESARPVYVLDDLIAAINADHLPVFEDAKRTGAEVVEW